MSYTFLRSVHAIARLVWLLLQSLNTILSMSSWSFIPRLPLWHPFCSDSSTLSLSKWLYIFPANIPVISFHIKYRQDIGLYQLHCLLPGRFGTVLSFQRSSNLVRVFLYQECCTATGNCNDVRFFNQYRCTSSFPVAFQLGIFLHCTYYHFLADFNFLHTV